MIYFLSYGKQQIVAIWQFKFARKQNLARSVERLDMLTHLKKLSTCQRSIESAINK